MGKKGGSRHVKRLAAPNYMKLHRKASKFIAKPNPGRFTLESSLALVSFIREKIAMANTSKEAETAIKTGKIEVNGKVIRDPKYPVGFGDEIKLVPSKETYHVSVGKYGMFNAKKADKGDRTLKVIGKYLAKSGKLMIRLNNGDIFPADKEIMVNDSVVLEKGKIAKRIKMEKGARCLVTKGVHAPQVGTIQEIKKGTAIRDATVKIEGSNGSFETLVENVIAVGA